MSYVDERYNDVPFAIEPFEDFNSEKHIIYDGDLRLHYEEYTVTVRCVIYFFFLEKNRLQIEGTTASSQTLDLISGAIRVSSRGVTGSIIFTNVKQYNDGHCSFRGKVLHFRKGKENSHKEWKWAYANMPYFSGNAVRYGTAVSLDRLLFIAGNYRIYFENRTKLFQYASEHSDERYLSHYCLLEQSDGGPVDYKTACKIIDCFSLFISFVVGRRHAPYLIHGFDNDSADATEYHNPYEEDITTGVYSWKPYLQEQDLVYLWPSFYHKYNSEKDTSDILKTAVHWYLEANANHGMLDGAFIMGFTGLELMYNVLFDQSLAKNNEEKVRSLTELINKKDSISAASVANMRNQLVHYDSERRKRYRLLSVIEKRSRMAMLLQLLELSILYWLGYKGHYNDRLSILSNESLKVVPWMKQ